MMFEQIRDDFKKGSERMKTQAQQLGRTPARIRARKRWAIQQLRHRARMSQGSGQEWLFEIQTDTLHRVEGLIEGAPELPLFQRFLDNAEQRVNDRLSSYTAPPIEDYAVLNARNASKAVIGLDRVDLLRVERFERAQKNRKTVIAAVERERIRLLRPPERPVVN